MVFDNDGLLLDTEVTWTRAQERLWRRHGQSFTPEHKRALIGSSRTAAAAMMESMLDQPGGGERLVDEVYDLVMEEALKGVDPRPGAMELLSALDSEGMPLAVASNSARKFVERVLEGAGLLDGPFRHVVTADDVARPKPAPDLYLAACSALDADPTRSAALEDSPPGVESAAAAGLYVIGVPYFPGTPLPRASLLARSLSDEPVRAALGLGPE